MSFVDDTLDPENEVDLQKEAETHMQAPLRRQVHDLQDRVTFLEHILKLIVLEGTHNAYVLAGEKITTRLGGL